MGGPGGGRRGCALPAGSYPSYQYLFIPLCSYPSVHTSNGRLPVIYLFSFSRAYEAEVRAGCADEPAGLSGAESLEC